jgi:DNA-binding response OmpR family regulator
VDNPIQVSGSKIMLNIMLIDDQALLAKWLREDLSDEKYQISHTTNTDDIHDDIATFKPDIILLDVCLDGFERWDILHWIKLKSPHVPVLIVGTYNSIADDPRLAQADGYIIKDIYMNKIENKMMELCRNYI